MKSSAINRMLVLEPNPGKAEPHSRVWYLKLPLQQLLTVSLEKVLLIP